MPATVSYANGVATLDPASDLQANTLYNVTVAATVADLTGNTLGGTDTWSFTTNVLSAFADTTVADFNAGTVGGCIVDGGIGDGALKLNLPSTSCVFESRIFDAGDLVDWTTLTVNGNASGWDLDWLRSPHWQHTARIFPGPTGRPAACPFTNLGGQYIQYRATLSTTDSGQTPVLEEVTLNYAPGNISVLDAPIGTLSNWDEYLQLDRRAWRNLVPAGSVHSERYTGLSEMVHQPETGCAGGTACSLTPADMGLPNGDYQWRVMDYGAYGYGIWTNFKSFTLNAACYTLTTDVNSGWEWDGECTSARTARAATRPARWCS